MTASEPPDLLPCPFCGGAAKMLDGIYVRNIECTVCGAIGPDGRDAEAIAMWNTRRPPPSAPETGEVERVARIIQRRANAHLNWEWTAARDILAPKSDAAPTEGGDMEGIWAQAQRNHAAYSATGDTEHDIRFFTLGLVGEAGEVANFVKKRWRDGDGHDDDLRKECADVLAYLMMLANALGMTPASLIEMVAYKQQVFVKKMEARKDPQP
jgi:Lar family restriction alleviation protein